MIAVMADAGRVLEVYIADNGPAGFVALLPFTAVYHQ